MRTKQERTMLEPIQPMHPLHKWANEHGYAPNARSAFENNSVNSLRTIVNAYCSTHGISRDRLTRAGEYRVWPNPDEAGGVKWMVLRGQCRYAFACNASFDVMESFLSTVGSDILNKLTDRKF
jgi:phage host-nuclease inhibitor protein Gam